MTSLVCDNYTQVPFGGHYGNFFSAEDGKTLAAMQIADTLDLATIPATGKIIDGHLINAALGAGTTLSVGWRYKDGTAGGSATALLAATATSGAGRINFTMAPFVPTLPKDIVIYATLAGGVATGRVDAVVKYRMLGGK